MTAIRDPLPKFTHLTNPYRVVRTSQIYAALSKVGYVAMQIAKHHQIRGMRHGPLVAGYSQSRPPKHA